MKFLTLAKIPILSFWGFNKAIHSDDLKERRKMFLMIVVLIFALVSVCSTFVSTAMSYAACGLAERIPAVMLTSACGISLIVTILRTNGFLYSAKDYDMIMSLPVSKFDVVLSRLAVIYFICAIFTLPIMLSGDFIYLTSDKATPMGWISVILTSLFAPLLPIAAGVLIGTVISFIASRMKHKNVVTTILLFIFMIGILAFPYLTEKLFGISENSAPDSPEVIALLTASSDKIESTFLPARWLTIAVGGNPFMLLTFAVVFAGSFAAVAALVSVFYKDINTKLSAVVSKGHYKLGKIARSSPFMAIYKKDLRRFFASSTFMVNMGFGVIFTLVLAVAAFIIPRESFAELEAQGVTFDMICDAMPFLVSALLSVCIIAAPLISLEGKSLWIVKTMPVKYETLFLAKMAVQLTVTLVPGFICCAALSFALPFSAVQILFLFITTAVMEAFFAELGILVGLAFANYEWTAEVTVIKQGAATGICMIIGIIVSIVPVVLCFVLGGQPFTAIFDLIILAASCVIHSFNRRIKP